MIKSVKRMKNRKNGVRAIGIAYLSLVRKESLCFILKFLLDYKEDNLVILVIKSLFLYQGLILPY